MVKSRKLKHFLPDVGAIEAELFDESSRLYEFLEQAHEILRVERLTQLGLVQSAWPVARHTRWDFTMLLLDLIRRTKDLPSVHVGSPIQAAPGLRISSARELLSAWALLLNLGHLHGTFATESELLFEIKRNPSRKQLTVELLESVPASALDFATRVLHQERSYQFYQVLAFYRLERIGRGRKQDREVWQTLLAAYLSPRPDESEALSRARLLFRRARRLTFLTLDASLTPSPLEIRLSELSSSPEILERLLLPPSDPFAQDELQSLEEFLAREIYNGPEVLAITAAGRAELRKRLRDGLTKNGLRYTVESAAKTDHHTSHHAVERCHLIARGVIGTPILTTMLSPRSRLLLERRRLEDAFERWGRILGASVSLVFVQDAAGNQLIFQTHAHEDSDVDRACAIAGAVQLNHRFVAALASQSAPLALNGLEQMILTGGTRGVIEAALSHFFRVRGYWEWKADARYLCVIGTKSEVQRLVHDCATEPGHSKTRRHELEVLEQRIGHVQASTLAVAVGNLVLYGEDRVSQLAELDGVIVGVDRRRSDLVLTLIEAKCTSGAESKARSQLRTALTRLSVAPTARVGGMNSEANGRRGHAWVHLRSRYSRA